MLTTVQTPVDLTDEEANYLLNRLYANTERADVWSAVRSKIAARLGKR